MSLPAFTAHASLDTRANRYRMPASMPAGAGAASVVPQLGGKTFKGTQGCISDCIDQHPGWTRGRCALACRDPLTGVDLSTSPNELNAFLSDFGLRAWETGCGALISPALCSKVADEIRRQS